MRNAFWWPARGRRLRLAAAACVAAMMCLLALPARAQDTGQQQPPPATQPPGDPVQAPAQPQPAQANPFMFERDAGMLTFFIKADKTADFEKVMSRLHMALAGSDRPERRQMAEGWKLYKAAEPGPNNTVLYVNFISPVLKGADYTVSKILAEVFPQEVQELFVLYRDAFAGLSRAELELIEDFGAEPTPAAEEPPGAPAAPSTPATPQP